MKKTIFTAEDAEKAENKNIHISLLSKSIRNGFLGGLGDLSGESLNRFTAESAENSEKT
ncbi:MAG: hypothetical protein ACLQPD_29120 [Desulfomonilaceae bacterium]